MSTTLTILGCGASGGVPLITGDWGECDPHNPKNRRTRTSALITYQGKRLLIDAGPDVREQLLRSGIHHVDGVFVTHAHFDHIGGLPDLRFLSFGMKQSIPIYADDQTMAELKRVFGYAFTTVSPAYPAFLHSMSIEDTCTEIAGIPVRLFRQHHGKRQTSLGIRVEDVAYSTDFNQLPEAALACLQNLRLWAADCLQMTPHPTHADFATTLEYVSQLRPVETILIHLSQHMDYDTLCGLLPPSVRPAYDGLVVSV